MGLTRKILILALCAFAVATPALAGDSPRAPVPRIGLVLGGGGARGFAHLGVLRELEKLRIPISCIAGTSAGALIGGIYANGESLDTMQREFREADWDLMLSGRPPRSSVPYNRKREDYRNLFDFTVGARDGELRLPLSAINAQLIDLYIRKLTHERSIDSFDHLPIPFRAIATDLSNGDAVVFDHGSLATALRASMAVPGLFDLVQDDKRLLVDGGLARNLPIEDIKGRCADRVIVVDVGTPLLKKDEIRSWLDVLEQSSNLIIARNVREQLALLGSDDILIRPDLNGFSTSSFADNQAIIERGAAAVAPLKAQLATLSLSPEAYAAWKAALVAPAEPHIDVVRVAAPTKYVDKTALEQLLGDARGISLDDARRQLDEVFDQGDFDSLTYSIAPKDGRNVLEVYPVERSVGPNYLRFGLSLNSSTPGESNYTFMASHLRTWINSAGASWRNDIEVGGTRLLHSEFYQPMSATSPFFVAAYGGYQEQNWPLFDAAHKKYAQVTMDGTSAGVDAGLALGKYGEMRAGPYWSHYVPQNTLGTPLPTDPVPREDINERGMRWRLVVDQFDNPRWPRSGYLFNSAVNVAEPSLGSGIDTRYYALTADKVTTFQDVSVRMTVKMNGNLNGLGSGHDFYPQFLGGFLNLSGYQQNELYGSRVALGRLMTYWRAASLPSALGSGLYVGGSLESGKVWDRGLTRGNSPWLLGGSVFVGADTLIGPLFVGLGNARGGTLTGYMFLGVDY
ncbi:patatin-like phospholipase family protein [Paludibacterium yongneupense]|uniref:patatin-like phospholipase family protein n=1 Tax=Paludibacterium yongneupense TaxID=400061 RepID=UPI000412FDD0|nr:patatin-like phospholipase family protein [Paludibacterium yongneupense]